jgi:hypothetical protein
MDTKTFRDWFGHRVTIADEIKAKYDYGLFDAEILLCCALSAIAANIWPGKIKDKKRFIQLLVDFAPSDIDLKIISIPMLVDELKDSAQKLEDKFYPSLNKIVTAKEIDHSESDIISVVPEMSLNKLREFSYAAIIYRDLRCALIHEFTLNKLETWGMSSVQDEPSYNNEMDAQEFAQAQKIMASTGQRINKLIRTRRKLFIPYPYLRKVVISVAENVFNYWDQVLLYTKDEPAKWWIEG